MSFLIPHANIVERQDLLRRYKKVVSSQTDQNGFPEKWNSNREDKTLFPK